MIGRDRPRWWGWALIFALAAWAATPARAQTTTGSIRGVVTHADGSGLSGAEITARDTATGMQRSATSQADGSYALLGLRPGLYELSVRFVGARPQTRQVQVLVGTTLQLTFIMQEGGVELAPINVAANANVMETRTSEVATNVTQEQVNNLPTFDRNFLYLAQLAPGTRLQGTSLDDTRKTISFGAQEAEQINVFIDGASYKNDMIQGGVAGQDASYGNPFPRNAVQEFRVITQNFKAEYQQASSGIITATTQSGTNTWRGNAFFSYADRGAFALTPTQLDARAANPSYQAPDYSRYNMGLSFGGPLQRDRLFFFGSYEGNYQDRAAAVTITPVPTGYPALDTVNFAQYNGDFQKPFRQTLLFGKLTWARTPTSTFELSVNSRLEHDVRDFGDWTSYQSATRFQNSVSTAQLRHTWTRGAMLNEAQASYQRYHYNPVPENPGTINRFYGFGCCAQIGSNVSIQDFTQTRFTLRDDLTYSGFHGGGDHVMKFGARVDFANYDETKRNSENPRYVFELWWDSTRIPERVEFQSGNPQMSTTNQQIGLYAQDDWSPTRPLTLNLGVRWDFETHMINTDYVTPQAVRDSLTKYAASLIGYPFDPNRYFSDGTQRHPFYGMIQPRLGFSYQLDSRGQTTVFGGWGIYYDRSLFDQTTEERFALQHPSYAVHFDTIASPGRIAWDPIYMGPGGIDSLLARNPSANAPEVKLLPNDLRPPVSQQFTLGLRRMLGDFMVSGTYTGVRSKNRFTFYWTNMNFTCAERSFAVGGCFTANGIPGYSTILEADNAGKSWYDAFALQVDRPYRAAPRGHIGWGGGLAYTFAQRQTSGYNDNFSFPNPVDYPKQVRNDERHRVVLNWITDLPWVWGFQFSGVYTWGSGQYYDTGDRFGCSGIAGGCTATPTGPAPDMVFGGFKGNAYSVLDLRLRKLIPFPRGTMGVTVDLFNAFNTVVYGGYNTGNPLDTANYGTPNRGSLLADPRRLQVGVDYGF